MLDPRASAHPIPDQAELLICIAAPHFGTLRDDERVALTRRPPEPEYSSTPSSMIENLQP